jgi:hypothetical protein
MSLSERFTEVEGYGSFGPRSTSQSIAASVIPKVLANLSAQAREGVLFTSFREVLSDCPGRAGSSPLPRAHSLSQLIASPSGGGGGAVASLAPLCGKGFWQESSASSPS